MGDKKSIMDTILVSWSGWEAAFKIPFSEEQAARLLSAELALARKNSPPKAWADAKQGRCLWFPARRLRFYDAEKLATLYEGQIDAPARFFQWPMRDTRPLAEHDAEALRAMQPVDDALCWDGAAAVLAGAGRNMAARDRFFAAVRTVMEPARTVLPGQTIMLPGQAIMWKPE